MMQEDKIDALATEIAMCYLNGKNLCDTNEFVDLFLDIRETARAMIIQRYNKDSKNLFEGKNKATFL